MSLIFTNFVPNIKNEFNQLYFKNLTGCNKDRVIGEKFYFILSIWQAQIIDLTNQNDKIELYFKIIRIKELTILQINSHENCNKRIENKIDH